MANHPHLTNVPAPQEQNYTEPAAAEPCSSGNQGPLRALLRCTGDRFQVCIIFLRGAHMTPLIQTRLSVREDLTRAVFLLQDEKLLDFHHKEKDQTMS